MLERELKFSPGPSFQLPELDDPVRGLAAGQSAVYYDGDRVTAQATIDEVLR